MHPPDVILHGAPAHRAGNSGRLKVVHVGQDQPDGEDRVEGVAGLDLDRVGAVGLVIAAGTLVAAGWGWGAP